MSEYIDDDYDSGEVEIPVQNDTSLMDKFVTPKAKSSKKVILENGKEKIVLTKYRERYLPDITTANLDDFDKWRVMELLEIASFIQNYAEQKGLDLAASVNYFVDSALNIANVSKGYKFGLLERVKTNWTKKFSDVTTKQKIEPEKRGFSLFG